MESFITVESIGQKAIIASKMLSSLSCELKKNALIQISKAILQRQNEIINANEKDLNNARKTNMSPSMTDRLTLSESRIKNLCDSVASIANLKDPIGNEISKNLLENGLEITKVRVPIGVIGIIYEARPNVTVDAAVLCFKSGNSAILRGGKEAIYTNKILCKIIKDALTLCEIDSNCISLITDTSRQSAISLMKANGIIDVLIPRGGKELIASTVLNASVPVIETGSGNCHVYIDSGANLQMGVDIVLNAKASRPSVCNACETLLVHKDIAKEFLPLAQKALDKKGVTMLGCTKTKQIISNVTLATDDDYATEFLDYILAVKVVDSLDDAISHIEKYSTKHSEAIVTNNMQNAKIFTDKVDSAVVYVNASTRFTDGYEFGFGAEIGISTSKIHARGPMGLLALTSYKYIVHGNGQIRL